MKVSSNKDSVDISQASRAKHGGKAGATQKKSMTEGADASMSAGAASSTANVEISGEAKALAAANQAAKADETNEAKIARVKSMINAGSYKPDFGKVADKMVNETLLQDLT